MGKNNNKNKDILAELKLTDRQFLILTEMVFNFTRQNKKCLFMDVLGRMELAQPKDLEEINQTLNRITRFIHKEHVDACR